MKDNVKNENVKKEKFRENVIITTYGFDGKVEEYYPIGAAEVKESIESWKQSIYNGDIKWFTLEWNSTDIHDELRTRNKLLFTSYDGKPEMSARILDFGKNI